MSTLQLGIVCVTLLVVVGAACWTLLELRNRRGVDRQYERILREVGESLDRALERPERELGPELTGKSVVVHTRRPDDQTIRGIVCAHYADRLELRDVTYSVPGGTSSSAQGLVDVPWLNVSSCQVLARPEE